MTINKLLRSIILTSTLLPSLVEGSYTSEHTTSLWEHLNDEQAIKYIRFNWINISHLNRVQLEEALEKLKKKYIAVPPGKIRSQLRKKIKNINRQLNILNKPNIAVHHKNSNTINNKPSKRATPLTQPQRLFISQINNDNRYFKHSYKLPNTTIPRPLRSQRLLPDIPEDSVITFHDQTEADDTAVDLSKSVIIYSRTLDSQPNSTCMKQPLISLDNNNIPTKAPVSITKPKLTQKKIIYGILCGSAFVTLIGCSWYTYLLTQKNSLHMHAKNN